MFALTLCFRYGNSCFINVGVTERFGELNACEGYEHFQQCVDYLHKVEIVCKNLKTDNMLVSNQQYSKLLC